MIQYKPQKPKDNKWQQHHLNVHDLMYGEHALGLLLYGMDEQKPTVICIVHFVYRHQIRDSLYNWYAI